MARSAKQLVVETASALGFPALVLRSGWRNRRLLILCYHGVSQDDEHEWRPGLYIPASLLSERMEALRRLECSVLPLGEALDRLDTNSLPPRSVVLTFDDGTADFARTAMPVLRRFGYPVTLYWTTYYSAIGLPVYNVMLPYLLWKARGRTVDWPDVFGAPIDLDDAGRERARLAIRHWCDARQLDAAERDDVLRELARRAGVDDDRIRRERILSLITPAEAAALAREGVDLQLHTHRHQVWRDPAKLREEIDWNREMIVAASGREPEHFCYPSGSYTREVVDGVRSAGLRSATTCRAGLAGASSPRLELPRLLDHVSLAASGFEAWVSGWASLGARRGAPSMDSLADGAAGSA